nr:NADH dehydrogenase subunit 3 [Craspedonirmus immer]
MLWSGWVTNPVVMWSFLVMIVATLLWVISISFHEEGDSSEFANEPFECGIEEITPNRTPLSLHFLLVAILFVIFDIEAVVSVPLIWWAETPFLSGWIWLSIFVLLYVGLILEIFLGSLDWKS